MPRSAFRLFGGLSERLGSCIGPFLHSKSGECGCRRQATQSHSESGRRLDGRYPLPAVSRGVTLNGGLVIAAIIRQFVADYCKQGHVSDDA